MRRALTRYTTRYPFAIASLLEESGYHFPTFWHNYSRVSDWSSIQLSDRQKNTLHHRATTVLAIVALLAGLLWLATTWWLFQPATLTEGLILTAYSVLWLYALPLLVALVASAIMTIVSLRTASVKTLPRRIVARILERQVVKLIDERGLLVVAVTGSIGKTSTKLAIAHLLSKTYRVQAHRGNYNSEIGLPLSIFGQEVPRVLVNPLAWLSILWQVRQRRRYFDYDALVLEMGADQPGDIQKFMRYITPDIGVITAIAEVHTEQFGGIEAIFDEKWALATGSKRVLLNYDDTRLSQRKDELPNDSVKGYGLEHGDWRLARIKQDRSGYSGELKTPEGSIKLSTQLIARHSLYSLTAACAVADWCSVSHAQIKSQAASWKPVKGRMNPLPGKNDSLIIDDSYNSSPASAIAALDALYALSGRHIAILGSMNELGDYEAQGHREVGRHCAKLDYLITIGSSAEKYLAPAAKKAGLAKKRIISFDSPYAAGDYVAGLLKKNDKVLVKGSQNLVFSEEATKLLLADPTDIDQLVRQSSQWMRKKESQLGNASEGI